MADPILPRWQSAVLAANGSASREWYDFFRDLLALAAEQSASDEAIVALQAAVAALEEAEPDLGQLFGDMSVAVDGLLGQVVQLRLVNDATAPGTTYYYGTDADGTKGWHLLGDALLEGTGITLTVDGTTGEITIALADLSDAGGGSFLLFTRDAQGRVSGTSAGDASDVPYDDAGNTYVLGANVQAALDATDAALAGKQPLDTDLTAIAALSPANDDVIQRKAGAWTNRTMAQLLADLGIAGSYQPLDATLTALASQNWALNALPIGSGADTVFQVAFAANTFPARASTGNLVAKTITDDALLLLADATVPRLGTTNTWALTQTFSLSPIISTGATNALFVLDANAATARRMVIREAGVNRWQLGADGSSNFILQAHNSGGSIVGNVFSIPMGTQTLAFTVGFTTPSAVITGGSVNGTPIGASTPSTGAFTDLSNSGSQVQTGVESAALFTANVDNLAIAATTRILRIQSDASRNLTGIVASSGGRRVLLCNVGSNDIVLVHSATSTAANQFRCPGSANFTLNTNDSIEIWYDAVNSRWRPLGY